MIILLLIFWIILSGQFSLFFIMSALVSLVFTLFIDKKIFSSSPLLIGIRWSWFLYSANLVKEMFKSSLSVAKIIWFNSQEVKPICVEVNVDGEDETSQVLRANSITLTPGTMTLKIQDNKILVHALNEEFLEESAQENLTKKEQSV